MADALIHLLVKPTEGSGIPTPFRLKSGNWCIPCDPTIGPERFTAANPNELHSNYPPSVNCAKCRRAVGLSVGEDDFEEKPALDLLPEQLGKRKRMAIDSLDVQLAEQIQAGEGVVFSGPPLPKPPSKPKEGDKK